MLFQRPPDYLLSPASIRLDTVALMMDRQNSNICFTAHDLNEAAISKAGNSID